MKNSQSFKDLIVWQKSIKLSVKIYKITEKFNENEKYGLISQTRRCTVSIPSNIVYPVRNYALCICTKK